MREIKFRAWDQANERFWDACIWGGKDWALRDDVPTGFPVSQYTGLKDKNGKEIYEGDILKRSHERTPGFLAVIEFHKGAFYGVTHPLRNHYIEISKLSVCDYGHRGYDEIIGNIYEHPELIKP